MKQDEPYRSILLHLQAVIERTLPEIDLKFKYRIPFYYFGKTPFCYLNQSKDYVDVGFWHSAHMTVHIDKMVTKDRKIIKSLRYFTLEEMEDSILIEVLHDAFSVKEKVFRK